MALLFSSQALRAGAVPNLCVGASWSRPKRGKGRERERKKERFGGGALTCSPRTALLEHVDFRIPPGVHAVSVAKRQTSVGLVEDDAWKGRRWSMII